MARKTKDLTGQRFGRLMAIRQLEERQWRNTVWECQCDCGNIYKVAAASLMRGSTKSCGCLRRRKGSDSTRYKHGKVETLLYCKWAGMIQRCTNPKESHYSYYGGRGITVCNEWREL